MALGLFDYIEEPHKFTIRMYNLCQGSVIASFPKWDWLKGPVRHIRYRIMNNCPIFNFTRRELDLLFQASGFSRVLIMEKRSGFIVTAHH